MRKALAAIVFVILAVGLVGCGGGGSSGGGSGVTVPADPTGLTTLVLSSSQIDLTWTDNASNEESYKIERGIDGTTFAEIASVSAGVVTYSDTGLLDSTVYYYRVRAYNSAGYSGYTAVASGITSPAKSAFSGVVYEQTSDNGIVPAGGTDIVIEVFSAKSSKSGGAGSDRLGPPLSTTTARTGSNGRYSVSSIDVPRGSTVRVSIAGSETPQSQETFATATADEKASAIQKKRGRTKQTIRTSVQSSVNTLSDITLPRCEILVPAGAVAGDVTDVVLTPYHRAEVLPVRLPDNYAMLAAGDCYASSTVTFASGKEADVYVILPSSVRAEELSSADIRLMELINGSWVIATGKGKAYTTGTRYGHVGPHDTDTPARLGGVRPWCWVVAMPSTANISGTVKNVSGAAVAGAFVFGGGSKAHTASDGSYTLKNVAAVKTNMLVSVTVTADGYDGASQFAGVSPGQTTTGVNFTLQTSSQTAELSGKVTSAATSAAISGATVTLRTDAGIRSMKYDNKNTATDLTDDTFYVTPPAGVTISAYVWKLTTPAGATFASTQATGSSVIINQLATEAGNAGNALGIGAYKVELEMTLASGKKVTVSGGFLLKQQGIVTQISDVTLPLTFDDQMKLTGVTDANGAYRISNVPTGETFYAQATASGYTDSAAMTLATFTAGEIRTQDFALSAASTDTTAPSVPNGLTATASGSSQVNLTWSASSDNVAVKGYNVYRDGVKIASPTTTSYIDTALTPSTTYAYTVAAYDAAGNASAQSASVIATTPGVDTTPPSVPGALVAGPTSPTQMSLSWLPSTDDVGVSGYYVYRGGVLVGTATTASYYDTGLTASTSYTYEVAAYDASGNVSAKSNSFSISTFSSADTQAPSVPTGLTATAISSGQINLAWSASTDNTSVAGYKVYRNSVYLTSVTGTSYGDSGLSASTTYTYAVAAYDATGNASAQSGAASATTNASNTTIVYSDGFSSDPGWITNDPTNIRWESSTGTMRCIQSNNNMSYGYKSIGNGWDGVSPFVMEWDLLINSCQWSAGATFGLFDPQLLYANRSIVGDWSIGDSGRGHFVGGNNGTASSSPWASKFSPSWSTGVWYHNTITYDPSAGTLTLEIRDRATNALFDTFTATFAGTFPSNFDRIGVSRMHMNNQNGYAVDFNLDNVKFTVTKITSTWSNKIPSDGTGSPSRRGRPSMVWNGNRVIMFGGWDGASCNDLWWYDPSTNAWTQKIAKGAGGSPAARSAHTMVWDGTRVILFGGLQGSTIYNDLWWYDPTANAWTAKTPASSPPQRRTHAMAWDGTRVIMFGGQGSTALYNDLWWYDPVANAWTQKIANGAGGSPSARSDASIVWDGTRIILFGGYDNAPCNDLWWYDPSANTWTQKIANGTGGSPSARHAHTSVWNGTKMVVFAGLPGSTLCNDLWRYDPATNVWGQQIANGAVGSPLARVEHAMVWDGGKNIIFGGRTSLTPVTNQNDLWWEGTGFWNDMPSRTHGVTLNSSFSNQAKSGWKITTKTSQIKVKSVTVAAGSGATSCYVYASDKTTLIASTTAKSGDTFTFATPPLLSASTTYYIVVNNNGAAYTDSNNWNNPQYNYPYDLTEATLVASVNNIAPFGNDVTLEVYSIVSVVFQTSN